jgi:hypothetical protein
MAQDPTPPFGGYKHQVITGTAALVNSATVTVLSTSATALYTYLESPTADMFFEVSIAVTKPGFSTYADCYRVVGSLANDGSTFVSALAGSVLHWEVPITTLGYSGFVNGVTVDVVGGNIRVRVSGTATASLASATAWLGT